MEVCIYFISIPNSCLIFISFLCFYDSKYNIVLVLGNLPVRGVLLIWIRVGQGFYCACRRCGWGLFGHFSLLYHFSILSPSLWETTRYRLKHCLKGPFSPKQPTNQNTFSSPNAYLQRLLGDITIKTSYCSYARPAQPGPIR